MANSAAPRGQRVEDRVATTSCRSGRIDGVSHPVEPLARGAVGGLEPGEGSGVVRPVALLPAQDRADLGVGRDRRRRRLGRRCGSASSARGSAGRPRRRGRCPVVVQGPPPAWTWASAARLRHWGVPAPAPDLVGILDVDLEVRVQPGVGDAADGVAVLDELGELGDVIVGRRAGDR